MQYLHLGENGQPFGRFVGSGIKPGIGHADYCVRLDRVLAGEDFPRPDARLVHRITVNNGVGAGKIYVLEHAGFLRRAQAMAFYAADAVNVGTSSVNFTVPFVLSFE